MVMLEKCIKWKTLPIASIQIVKRKRQEQTEIQEFKKHTTVANIYI